MRKEIAFGLILGLSFQVAFAQGSAKTQITPAKISEPSRQVSNDGKMNLDFVDAEISEVVKSISELLQRNFIIDDKVRGKITIISPNPVTKQEAYQAFISALEVKGFTVVRSGKLYKIVQVRDMKTHAIQTDVRWPSGGADIYITRLIPMNYINASEIVKSLKGFVSKQGDLTSYDPTNTLIVTETQGNLRRLLKIIAKLDQQGFQEKLEVISLKFAPASDTAAKLSEIFNIKSSGRSGRATGGKPSPAKSKIEKSGGQFISRIIPDERMNALIVMANDEGIRRVREVVEKIDRALEEDISRGKIHVHYLQYSDAVELAGTLTSISGAGGARGGRPSSSRRSNNTIFPLAGQQRQSSPPPPSGKRSVGGSMPGGGIFGGDIHITADIPTNSLVITSEPADYEALLPVIRKLDIRRPQAFIEAMIVEVDVDKAFDIGFSANLGTQIDKDRSFLFGATQFSGISSIAPSPTSLASGAGLMAGIMGRTIDIDIGGESLSVPVYGGIFRALQTNGTINILSTPNILTQDNMEAEIIVGEVVPFVTAQGRDINNQPINQVQRENVAITLRVTPQINESADITLDLFQEIQDIASNTDFGPTTSNRSAKTTVLVRDGQTISIGGLISERQIRSESKVPILGDIPIIGWFFKSKNNQKRKTSLNLFITPHIIRNPEDLQEMSYRKNEERRKFLRENNLREHPATRKYGLDKALPRTLNGSPTSPDDPTGSFLENQEPIFSNPLPPEEPKITVMKEEVQEEIAVEEAPSPLIEETPAPEALEVSSEEAVAPDMDEAVMEDAAEEASEEIEETPVESPVALEAQEEMEEALEENATQVEGEEGE